MFIDYFRPPTESFSSLLSQFPQDGFLILEDVLANKKSYKFIMQKMIDIMKYGFEIEEYRHWPVQFKFKRDDKKIHVFNMNTFIYNMVYWYGFMDMDRLDLLTEKYIIDPSKMDLETMCDWINDNIVENHPGDILSKNKTIDEIRHNQAAISRAFAPLMGLNVSIIEIINAAKEMPELKELLYFKVDEKLQPSEIEEIMAVNADRLVELLKQTRTGLSALLRSGKNISKTQVREIFMIIGIKSNINGQPIPVVINTNFLVDGLHKPSYIHASAQGARKALILSKKYMSVPGAFSKKINLLSTSASILAKTNEPCNSVVPITYHINDKKFLKLLDKRYYYDNMGIMRLLDYKSEEAQELIGKDIMFRSPCTCNGEDGICKYCYGELYEINKDLFSAGSYAATKNSEPLGQKVLSAKHEQKTDSGKISFNPEFDQYFDLISTEVTLSENSDNEENLSIILDDVQTEEIGDEEYLYVNTFTFLDESTGLTYHMKENDGAKLYLSAQLSEYYRSRKPKLKDKPIPLSVFTSDDGDVPLFMVETESAEVTEPIKVILNVLNNYKDDTNISGICQAAAEAFTSIGINYNFVHIEMIIRGLIRRRSDELIRPDFSRSGNHNDIQIMKVNKGLKRNPSALISLSYGYVKQVLTSASFYQKSAPSHLDALWVERLSEYIDQ